MGKGPAEETAAGIALAMAARTLARYEEPMREAMAAREAAQVLADDAYMGVKAAEEARDAAAWACEHPGLIPLSGETARIPAVPLDRSSP